MTTKVVKVTSSGSLVQKDKVNGQGLSLQTPPVKDRTGRIEMQGLSYGRLAWLRVFGALIFERFCIRFRQRKPRLVHKNRFFDFLR
jgi:hypothetical protein